MYDEGGEQVWERSLDLNGKVINGSNAPCPFLFQGQYYDKEIELAYNRFRYYDPDDGRYISKDPIGLLSGEYGFYNYVGDSNGWIDVFGLDCSKAKVKRNTSTDFGGQIVRGFKNGGEIMERLGNLRNKLRKNGFPNARVGLRGSSITGESSKGAGEFFSNPKADLDFFVVDDVFTSKMPLDGSGSVKSKYLDRKINKVLSKFGEDSTAQLGRKSSVRFIDSEALKSGGSYIIY
ncbi:RHS repeat domain-containing protein [Tenacibaculum maritimum]|uniref:RHS repeat domain-containing protein n=1 Tax=Tenacibaculum maritimum TaxID=107401 RepID=UPI00387788B9